MRPRRAAPKRPEVSGGLRPVRERRREETGWQAPIALHPQAKIDGWGLWTDRSGQAQDQDRLDRVQHPKGPARPGRAAWSDNVKIGASPGNAGQDAANVSTRGAMAELRVASAPAIGVSINSA